MQGIQSFTCEGGTCGQFIVAMMGDDSRRLRAWGFKCWYFFSISYEAIETLLTKVSINYFYI